MHPTPADWIKLYLHNAKIIQPDFFLASKDLAAGTEALWLIKALEVAYMNIEILQAPMSCVVASFFWNSFCGILQGIFSSFLISREWIFIDYWLFCWTSQQSGPLFQHHKNPFLESYTSQSFWTVRNDWHCVWWMETSLARKVNPLFLIPWILFSPTSNCAFPTNLIYLLLRK